MLRSLPTGGRSVCILARVCGLFEDDNDVLRHGMVMYDAFFARVAKRAQTAAV